MPRYVILEHDWNGVHYDLMLQHGEVLVSWRLESLLRTGTQSAIKLPDHRTVYLDFEGMVSGNRGSVKRVDEGDYRSIALTAEYWIVEITGKHTGKAIIRQVAEDQWDLEWQALH